MTSHVFRSKAELLVAMGPEASRWLPFTGAVRREGKFGSYPEALRYVNETIQANIATVEAVKAGLLGGDEGELITKYYGRPTGAEWYRDAPYSKPRWRTTYSVGVILRYDPRLPQGFLVVTAYPRNEDWEEKFVREHVAKSPGFRAFTRAMIHDPLIFSSQDELIDFGIAHVLHQHPEAADDLDRFLDHWLNANATDQQLEDLWTASNADFFLIGVAVRPFLTRVLQMLRDQRGTHSVS
ncbi:RNase A-like domain-containing protein [Pararhizobium sp. LjRoot238]|uniref:RNase A-like domain-containing protein n=1 Tax=Pararhizobium sp. LjRoot238 TaxID=3342293 RepID=UPI003ECE8DDC